MAELRAFRGWTHDELADRLAGLAAYPSSNLPARLEALDVGDGWRVERSEATIGREPPGPPIAGGAFERASVALTAYEFSDPSIVAAHFDPSRPLAGRRMLLELKVLGLRYLCGVEVVAVADERGANASSFGFRYDTLQGHLERGGEWFVVTKDHASGELRLCITSRWRLGDAPNAWSRAGFRVLSPYYRALWLHRAHERMRALLARTTAELLPARAPIVDEGPPTGSLPALPERAHARPLPTLAAAAALGAITGMRSMSGLSLLAVRSMIVGAQPGAGWAERWFARPATALGLGLFAIGELAADKSARIGDRTEPVPFTARITLGACCGALLAMRWRRRTRGPAAAGALAAAASTTLAYTARRRTSQRYGIPSALLGVVEDAVVLAAMVAISRTLGRSEPAAYSIEALEKRTPAGRRLVTA